MAKALTLSANAELQARRAAIESSEKSVGEWKIKWGWITEKYKKRVRKIQEIMNRRSAKASAKKRDLRDPRPWPQTTAQECGWLSGRREFGLELFGPDVPPKPPLEPPGLLDSDDEYSARAGLY